ncbi:MAG: hypothetical protein AB7O59_00855 [Pirellulales bacterium]
MADQDDLRADSTHIGRCPLARLAEVQAFINTHWRAGHILARDAELLRWQHRATATDLALLIATQGDAIVGLLGMIPVGFNLRGVRLSGNWLALWATAAGSPPALGIQLLAAAMRAGDFTGVLGANQAAMKVYRGLRWATMEAVPRLVRVSSAAALKRLLGDDVRVPQTLAISPPIDAAPATVRPGTIDDLPRWDIAWRDHFAPQLVSTWKDGEYLRWRYFEHPRFDYQVLFAADGTGRLAGLAVYRQVQVADRGSVVMRVVEFLARPDVAVDLARALSHAADAAGAAFSDFYVTGATANGSLATAGFVPEGALEVPLPGLLQPVDFSRVSLTAAFHVQSKIVPQSAALIDEALYFTRSDGDQDRPN